jgi:outer membrane protein OmpA-like peptidoglycan-associated protein
MRKKTGILTLIVVATAICFNGTAIAQEATEHPLIRPFPGSTFDDFRSEQFNFGEYEFRVGTPPRNYTSETISGLKRTLRYFLYKDDGTPNRDVSQVEYFENFKAAALKKGGVVKWEDRNYGLVFTIPREDGGITWCHVTVAVSPARTTLNIIDEKPLVTSLEFTPSQMMAALDADGKIALYGILFDFDKATLQQFSNKQLQDVLTLLIQNPELRLEIQGHTDSDGSEAYNKQLSERRAESVLNYLVLFGVDPSRLQARGYGESMSVAPNDSDENKAKNRRVELVRMEN